MTRGRERFVSSCLCMASLDRLSRWALKKYASGRLDAKEVGELSSLAWQGGWRGQGDHDRLAFDLQKLGSKKSNQNAKRDLHRILYKHKLLDRRASYTANVRSKGGATFAVNCNLPSEKISQLVGPNHERLSQFTFSPPAPERPVSHLHRRLLE